MTVPSQPGDPPTTQADTAAKPGEAGRTVDQSAATAAIRPIPPFIEGHPTSDPRELPASFGRYQIRSKLGRGGMGTVYLAHDTQLDRLVALKVPHFGPERAPQVVDRFYREARSAALLHHPNICPVFDVGEQDGIPYLTMAYIEGQTLSERGRPDALLAQHEVARLVQKVALALFEAHSRGVIHRDLKPSNIMIDRRSEPVVMDFGLARRVEGDERLTLEGILLGTPAYMAPEQLSDNREVPGTASDIYSLGVILYELLTGQLPFQGLLSSVVAQILSQEPRPPSCHRPDLHPVLEEACLRAMAKDPTARFATMAELAAALGDYLLGPAATVRNLPEPGRGAIIDAKTTQQVLNLMRTWGWAVGLRKLKTRVQRAANDRKRAALQALADWLSGDRSVASDTAEYLKAADQWPALAGWAAAAQAVVAVRERDYPRAHKVLEQASTEGDSGDKALAATLAHTRGVVYFHQGKHDQALPELHQALALFGKDHFGTGRVLDTLGMVYAGKGNFHIAREFYEQALRFKQRFEDEAGLALSHGQLGRLHLDWGHLDLAEEHFQEDLSLSQKILDGRGEAQMYNHLGQVALARAEREASAGRRSGVRRQLAQAAGWLEESIRRSQEYRMQVPEGFAHKDRALAYLLDGNVDDAEEQARRAEELFSSAHFTEGTAQLNGVWGILLRTRGRYDDSLRKLRAALAYFENTEDVAEAARVQWEIARTLRAAAAPAPVVTRAFQEALERAEECRRDSLVERIEEDLREVDQEAYFRHIYGRVRGRGVDEDTTSLTSGASEVLTVMCLDLQGFADYARGLDPEEALLTLNQMMADLAVVLERHKARVTTYTGDGFLALLREGKHAERGVQAALDLMAALQEFDRPREILGLQLFKARIGINTGAAFLGNVGTYHKIDFTVLGPAVTLANRLMNWAEPGLPCISQATYEAVQGRFVYRPGSPRTVALPGASECEVWDVTARKQERPS